MTNHFMDIYLLDFIIVYRIYFYLFFYTFFKYIFGGFLYVYRCVKPYLIEGRETPKTKLKSTYFLGEKLTGDSCKMEYLSVI